MSPRFRAVKPLTNLARCLGGGRRGARDAPRDPCRQRRPHEALLFFEVPGYLQPDPGGASRAPLRPPSYPPAKLGQALTTSSRDELPVPHSFDRQQLVRDRANAPGRAAQRDDLEAGMLVEMNV